MIVNLYVGNHGRIDGIEDYIRLVRDLLARRGISLLVSPDLTPGATNLIIDEFTNYRENRRIALFKQQHPDTPLIFLLTEFLKRKFGVESLNLFGGLTDAAKVALLNVWLRTQRDDFGRPTLVDLLKVFLYSPALAALLAPGVAKFAIGRLIGRRVVGPLERFRRDHDRLFYFHYRYLGLMSLLHFADGVVSSHPRIFEAFRRRPSFAPPRRAAP
jgi:hypothetical protein